MYSSETTSGQAVINKEEPLAACCPLCGRNNVSKLLTAPDRFHLRTEQYTLIQCSSCSCVWLENPPTPAEMPYHYDEDYHHAITSAGSAANRWHRQRDLIASYRQSGSILDIGCSSGGFLSTMKGPAWKLYGIEMEAQTANEARSNTGAEVFVGDAADAPFPANSFDVITCFDILEHVYDPRVFLGKVHEWLKPGGVVYTMLPNISSWEARALGSYWYGLELPRHLFHFSPDSLRSAMTMAGLKEECLYTPTTSYVERSANYLFTEFTARLGGAPVAQAKFQKPSFAWRAVRKAMRIGLVTPYAKIASLRGCGASIEAVFSK
jgi:2-polyprenyl-3-methyl-5-hydroxy-6-metoxy-1,4-benzoquinol methylase